MNFDFPQALLLLPLALLPLLRNRGDALVFPAVAWLPDDAAGRWWGRAWRALSVLCITLIVVMLAAPVSNETLIERVGRGAEISILLDRSSSMDAKIRRDAPVPGIPNPPTQTKNEVVRDALSELLAQRPDNRYALTLFNAAALRVSPFSDDSALVQAGLDASGIGRGPSETNMGLALLAAVEAFEGRSYTGSRAIVLVSDGGARLEEPVRELISEQLARHRVSLYFVYIPSGPNSPDLERVGLQSDSTVEEIALHQFFEAMSVEYRVFQAGDPESMASAVRQIDEQQNLPLIWFETVPRVDYSRPFLIAALISALLLSGMAYFRLEHWR